MNSHTVLTSCVRNTDINLSIEAAKSPQGTVDAVRSVSGSHDDNVTALLESIHECQQLGHNATLHLTMGLEARGERQNIF